jgi:hypothetical protein
VILHWRSFSVTLIMGEKSTLNKCHYIGIKSILHWIVQFPTLVLGKQVEKCTPVCRSVLPSCSFIAVRSPLLQNQSHSVKSEMTLLTFR